MTSFWRYRKRLAQRAAFLLCGAVAWSAPQSDFLAERSRQGKELMAEGRFNEAIPVYEELVKAIPGNTGLVLNLAMAEEMAGYPAKAIPHLQIVVKAQPDSVPALTSIAMAHLQLHQPADAIAPLKKVIALNPRDVNARGMLAGAEMSVGRMSDAAAQYRELTTLAEGDPKAWYGLGKAYEALAAADFERLTKQAPQSGFVAFLVAETRVQRRQYRSAFFFYREALIKSKGLPGVHAGLAGVYQATGHADWARLEEEREHQTALLPCGAEPEACQFQKGDYLAAARTAAARRTLEALFWAARAHNELAVKAFDHLGQLPESAELHALKAQILHDHGKDLDAATEWRAALSAAPDRDNAGLKNELATSLFLGRDYEAAIPIIRDLLATEPASADLNFMLGESLWRQQQADAALPYLEAALKANPEMLPAHAALGLALVALNRNAEALKHLEQAASLDDDGSLHYSLARAYQAAGNEDRARKAQHEYARIQQRNNEVNSELAKEAEITAPAER